MQLFRYDKGMRSFSSVFLSVYADAVRRFRQAQCCLQLARRRTPVRYLFVLSPMRSGSTLLVHILCSHPDIGGYGERHQAYNGPHDLLRLVFYTAVRKKRFDVTRQRYVLDKMVFNYPIADRLLRRDNLFFIFLLRDPARSYDSAARLGNLSAPHRCYQDPAFWADYYRDRLQFMQQIAERVDDPRRCLTLCNRDLIHRTPHVLGRLQDFLQTETPFSEQYDVEDYTGVLQFGDPSKAIRTGRIVRRDEPAPAFTLPPGLAQEISRTQQQCLEALRARSYS